MLIMIDQKWLEEALSIKLRYKKSAFLDILDLLVLIDHKF